MVDTHDQLLFTRFRHRTLLSIGGSPMAEVYEKSMLQAAFQVGKRIHSHLLLYTSDSQLTNISVLV